MSTRNYWVDGLERSVTSEELMCLIETNDPHVIHLGVGAIGHYRPSDDDWERVGRIIGRNTELGEVQFWDSPEFARDNVEKFFRGCAANRSIRVGAVAATCY